MLTNFIFLAWLSSGSVFAASRYGKRYEQTLPLCAMGLVLLLFLFGLLGQLETGILCLCVLAGVFYLLTAVQLLVHRHIRNFLRSLVTPGFVLFLVAFWLLSLWNYGKLAASWDEFSHWVDVVKAMTYVNDFGTSPAANSAFQSYPPAIALFQYSLQKMQMLLDPGYSFSEWQVYLAYQVFFLAVMLPFFGELSFRHTMLAVIQTVIVFLIPLLFYPNLYNAVYIDPMLGILFGAGMAMILLRRKRDGWYNAYLFLLCGVLTLSKDVGFVLSLMLALAYAGDCLLNRSSPMSSRILWAPAALASAWIPRVLWSMEIQSSGAAAAGFNGNIDWAVLQAVLSGKDTSYRTEVVQNYREALLSRGITIEWISLDISYAALTVLSLSGLLLLWILFRKKAPEPGIHWAVILGIAGATLVLYVAGLCAVYLFKFSQYEALRLASMDRYLNSVFLGVWLLILLLLSRWLQSHCTRQELQAVFLLALILMAPVGRLFEFARGNYVEKSLTVRAPYETLHKEIQLFCDGDDRIYFVSQATTGFDYWVCRFNARPNTFNGNSWSIGEPFFEGDIWTYRTTPEDWQNCLFAEYDYVALYRVNDYFLKNYGHLFAQPEEIEADALYWVNRQTGLLEKCR